jgi:hypothetical protein
LIIKIRGEIMMLYVKFSNYFALLAEMDKSYGFLPLYSFQSCNDELIVDIPYIRIIFTPGKNLIGMKENGKRSGNIYEHYAGTSENKP